MHFIWEVFKCLMLMIAIVMVFFTIEAALRKRFLPTELQFSKLMPRVVPDDDSEPESCLIFYLPDRLADGIKSSAPVRNTWREFGDVVCVDYGTRRFNPDQAIDEIASKILGYVQEKQPQKLVLILDGIGAPLGTDVWAKIHKLVPKELVVKMVIVDGVEGPENMLSGGKIVAPLLSLFPLGPISNVLLGRAFQKLKPLPQDAVIQGDLDKTEVKQAAKAAMAPYKPSFQRDTLAYAAGHAELETAHFGGKKLRQVLYLACTRGNVEVNQPTEGSKWQAACADAKAEFVLKDVNASHRSFAYAPDVWNRAFRNCLSS